MEDALFAIADGEFVVGGKQQRRIVEALLVVLQVVHAGFLVVADDETQGIGESPPLLHPETRCVERHEHGALVVGNAPTQKEAVATGHPERRERPALPCGNHVDVPDDAYLDGALALPIRISHMPPAIMRLETIRSPKRKRFLERPGGSGTIGRALARLRPVFHALDADQPVEFGNHGLPIAVQIRIQFIVQAGVQHESSFHGKSRPNTSYGQLANYRSSFILSVYARVAERQTRWSQKPLSQDVRVQIPPRAPVDCKAAFGLLFLFRPTVAAPARWAPRVTSPHRGGER